MNAALFAESEVRDLATLAPNEVAEANAWFDYLRDTANAAFEAAEAEWDRFTAAVDAGAW